MELIRLTPENASKFIGYEILFKTRGKHIIKNRSPRFTKLFTDGTKNIYINKLTGIYKKNKK